MTTNRPARAGHRSEGQIVIAQQNEGIWTVIDPQGGCWWPDEDAAAEIDASADPAATAIRIAMEAPMRGEWRQ
jgi:hypothetical protein